jgi:hypothetical protein
MNSIKVATGARFTYNLGFVVSVWSLSDFRVTRLGIFDPETRGDVRVVPFDDVSSICSLLLFSVVNDAGFFDNALLTGPHGVECPCYEYCASCGDDDYQDDGFLW